MDLKLLGSMCRKFRIENGITVNEIGYKCHYTAGNVYKFERGELNNALILLTYIAFGLELDRSDIWQV